MIEIDDLSNYKIQIILLLLSKILYLFLKLKIIIIPKKDRLRLIQIISYMVML